MHFIHMAIAALAITWKNVRGIYGKDVDEITHVNVVSHSFDFLKDEPELYSHADIKRPYTKGE